MKLRLFATIIAAGGLLTVAGSAAALPVCGAAGVDTLAGWQTATINFGGCQDSLDGDSTWRFVSATVPLTTTFTVSENQGIGFDVYNVAFGFAPGIISATGQTVIFTASGTATEPFDATNFDSNVTTPTGGATSTVTAHVTALQGPVDILLTSTTGSHAPTIGGETPFTNNQNIAVTDTVVAIGTGITLNAMNNSFQVGTPTTVPEPMSLALLGVGLAGMGLARRKRKLT